jgi:hypothetical protein
MPVETDADRAVFVDDGGTASFTALFDADYQLIAPPFLDGGAEGAGPQITARSSDIPAQAVHGDAVTIDGRAYRAVEFKPDGTGMTVVRLQEG